MSCDRQGFDLLNKYGRRCFMSEIKRLSYYVWHDTSYAIACYFKGHDMYEPQDYNTGIGERYCKRCGKSEHAIK